MMYTPRRLFASATTFLSACICILLSASFCSAQTHSGVLTGECVEASTGAPLAGVSIKAMLESDTTAVRFTLSNAQGKYRFKNLVAGTYQVTFSILGYRSVSSPAQVGGTEPTFLKIEMPEEALRSEEVEVTASRHPEKVTDAPASVSIVSSSSIREHTSATPIDLVASVPGIDLDREGIAMATYASRSMHSVFGSDVLTMTDYHSMELPAIGGFYGILMPQISDDIDHVEVVRGPGSALYGPNAATGVINFISRSPFASQGTTVSVSGGERDYLDGTFRHAQAIGDRFAFKVSGHYLKATDWGIADDPKEDTAVSRASLALSNPTLLPAQKDSLTRIGKRDTSLELYSIEARADAIIADNLTANVTAGLTKIINDVALTEDFGGVQIQNWQYDFLQAHVDYGDLFLQGSINHNNTQGSYFLVTGAPIVDQSTSYTAQIQHHWDPIQNEKLIYGADYLGLQTFTDSTLYGPEDGHANVSIFGAYLQSETSLLDNALELTLAGRVDKHSYLTDPIFSPRAAAVYHINDQHLLRAMYNNTYLFPTENDMFADLLFAEDAFGFQNLGLTQLGIGPVNVRYTGPYVSGLQFQHSTTDPAGYDMHTTLVPGGQAIPSTQAVPALWKLLMGIAASAAHNNSLLNIPAPTSAQVGTYLAYLNLHATSTSDAFLPIPDGQPIDISDVKPQHQRTFELDYQGATSKTFQYEVDAYQTHYTAIRASTVALTPNVLINEKQLQDYLFNVFRASGMSADSATLASYAVASGVASLPLGVVQPTGAPANEQHLTDVLIGTREYLENTVEFYGIDAMAEIKPSDDWAFTVSGSILNKNYWYSSELKPGQDSSLQSAFALNIPRYRMSIGARYSGLTRGLSLELTDNWNDAFKMIDNYYVGDIQAAHILNLTVNYRIPSFNDLLLTLSVSNLLDNEHQYLIGAPYIGRLTVLRASYTLPSL